MDFVIFVSITVVLIIFTVFLLFVVLQIFYTLTNCHAIFTVV